MRSLLGYELVRSLCVLKSRPPLNFKFLRKLELIELVSIEDYLRDWALCDLDYKDAYLLLLEACGTLPALKGMFFLGGLPLSEAKT